MQTTFMFLFVNHFSGVQKSALFLGTYLALARVHTVIKAKGGHTKYF